MVHLRSTEPDEPLRQFHSFRRSGEYAGKQDSFRRSKEARCVQNVLTVFVVHMRQSHSFRRSREYTGKHDSFRRSKGARCVQNVLTVLVVHMRQFHSFRRSREYAGKHDSFRRSGEYAEKQDSFRRSKGARCVQNVPTVFVVHMRQSHSFRRSRGNVRYDDSLSYPEKS